jgi:DNA-binding XRE family transcriptional regulator
VNHFGPRQLYGLRIWYWVPCCGVYCRKSRATPAPVRQGPANKVGRATQPPCALPLDSLMANMQEHKTMTLNDWLEKHRMTQVELAARLGVSESTISRVRRGINAPGLDIAIKIQEATNNQVGLTDLIKSGRG